MDDRNEGGWVKKDAEAAPAAVEASAEPKDLKGVVDMLTRGGHAKKSDMDGLDRDGVDDWFAANGKDARIAEAFAAWERDGDPLKAASILMKLSPETKASMKAGSQVTVAFKKRDNTKGTQDDEVEVAVKPDSEIVGSILKAAGFTALGGGIYAAENIFVETAKEAFKKAMAEQAQGDDKVGVSVVEEGPNVLVLEHIAPVEPAQMAEVAGSDALMAAIAATTPADSDGAEVLAKKVHTAAIIEARLNRETASLVGHAAILAGVSAQGMDDYGAVEATVARAHRLAVLQASLDASKAAMAARTSLVLNHGFGEGSIPAWAMSHLAADLKKAKFGSPKFDAARAEAERAMPSILGLHARLDAAILIGADVKLRARFNHADQVNAAKVLSDDLARKAQSESKKPGAFGAAKMEAADAKLGAALESLAEFEQGLNFSMAALAVADKALGRQRPAFAARRLRLPEGARNTLEAASKVPRGTSDEAGRSIMRASLDVLLAHTANHLSRRQSDALALVRAGKPANSADADAISKAISILAPQACEFEGCSFKAAAEFGEAHAKMSGSLLAMERAAAQHRTLAAAWTSAYDADPSVDPHLLAGLVARKAKTTRLQALMAGARLRSAGGMWPWTQQND